MVRSSDQNDEYIGAQMRLQAARSWRKPEPSRTIIKMPSPSGDAPRVDTGDHGPPPRTRRRFLRRAGQTLSKSRSGSAAGLDQHH